MDTLTKAALVWACCLADCYNSCLRPSWIKKNNMAYKLIKTHCNSLGANSVNSPYILGISYTFYGLYVGIYYKSALYICMYVYNCVLIVCYVCVCVCVYIYIYILRSQIFYVILLLCIIHAYVCIPWFEFNFAHELRVTSHDFVTFDADLNLYKFLFLAMYGIYVHIYKYCI